MSLVTYMMYIEIYMSKEIEYMCTLVYSHMRWLCFTDHGHGIHRDVVMSNMEYRYVLETTYWTDQLMRIYMVIVIIYILINK